MISLMLRVLIKNVSIITFDHWTEMIYRLTINAYSPPIVLKTGASGLIAYRLISKENKWQWLQTSARLVYKNSKPDFILCTHRPLM